MNNIDALKYWSESALIADSPDVSKVNAINDFTDIDASFILKFADKNSIIFDIGSGTGMIINKIYDKVKKVIALEPFVGFTKFIAKSDNIEIINKSVFDFDSEEIKVDLITCYGFLQYLNENEAKRFYELYRKYLKSDGKIIVKNQFGVKEDVTVSGFSRELNRNYYSWYRHIDKEVTLLRSCGYKDQKVFDIYPPHCNRWDNTHFYAIVASVDK